MKGFIYIIKNTVNSKVYIGQTRVSVEVRWKEHLRSYKKKPYVLYNAMRKYGIDKFYVEILEICDVNLLDEREIYYIDLYDSTDDSKGYNMSIGGKTPRVKRPTLSIPDLIHLYNDEQWSTLKIAEKYKVSVYIVNSTLRSAGIVIRDRHDSASRKNKVDKEKLIYYLSKGKTLRKAAKLMGIPYTLFRNACIYNNIEYNSSKSVRH